MQLRRRPTGRARPDGGTLSSRQKEVLCLIADGYTCSNIAARLGLSERTVETHRARLIARTGAMNTAELTKYAIRVGLTKLEV